MIETKRFTLNSVMNFYYGILDDGKEIGSLANICDLLNELHEENQLLHKINEDAIDFMYDNFDLNIMFTDRELNDVCNEMGWELSEKGIKINQLEKENEQLKSDNQELKQDNDIKFWKHECIKEANANSVLLFELGKAIDGGYEVSDKFKDFMNDLNKSIENEKKKLERFGLND